MLGDTSAGELIVAGPWVRRACERHLSDRSAAAWTWSATSADVALQFFERVLRLPDAVDESGHPKPFVLEPALAFIVGSLMGWLGPDGYRRFREAYIEMGKGNAKTPMLAGLGLYGLVLDGEPAPEIYAAAVTRDQAKIMHRDAERMAEASPDLRAIVKRTVNNLGYDMGFFRPFSRDQGLKSGPRPHMALIDEVHEHPTGEVINKLRAGFKFRKQPLAVEITNSGFDRTSICWQHRQHAEHVLSGSTPDDRLFAYVCALDEGDDPMEDPSCWVKANPLLGVTITHEYLARQVQNAKHIPAETNTVLRLNFCQWTAADVRAIDMPKWDACPLPPTDLVGELCWGGLDLGQTDDFSAWVRLFVTDDGQAVPVARFWVPRAALEKHPNRPYAEWERAGWLTVTDGDITDYRVIEQTVLEDCRRDGVREVAYDKRFAEQMAQNLSAAGLTMVDQPQGFGLNEACRKLGELIVSGALAHGRNPILTWMATNYVERHGRGGEVRPDKEKAREKIDGIVALLMAIARWVRQPQWTSVYESRGLVTL